MAREDWEKCTNGYFYWIDCLIGLFLIISCFFLLAGRPTEEPKEVIKGKCLIVFELEG